MKKKERSKNDFTAPKVFYMVVALLLFCAIVSILFTANADHNRAAQYIRGRFEAKGEVQDGTLEIEGLDAILDVPEGEIRYYINKHLVFANGYARGDIVLQNPQACGYALQFRFYLADGSSNVPIYTSPLLKPGQYLDGDKLDRYVPSGKYECTYTVDAFDLADTSVGCGSVGGFLTMSVVC
ncbi:MAG: hypothetical protein IJT44_03450 [Clostridia bacterium]|nr:hypothetical protein [Clostridia bacterium]